MKVAAVLQYGLGNVVEAVPSLLNLKEKVDLDVYYHPIYQTDDPKKASLVPFPVRTIEGENHRMLQYKYDYLVGYPDGFLSRKGEYVREVTDLIIEGDSEVRRNMMVCRFFGASEEVKTPIELQTEQGEDWDDRPFVIAHNGGLNVPAWRKKKYPMFPRLIDLFKKETGLEVASIGSTEEYIDGTIDLTGKPLRETAAYIKNARFYIGTDTGTYHIAGAFGISGITIFTCTSITKNWDKDFHASIVPVQSDIECVPGQWGYHWHPECVKCATKRLFFPCQNISPQSIMEKIAEKMQ